MENHITLKIIMIFYSIRLGSSASYLRVSVNEPFLLSSTSSITTLDPDISNNFLVGFQDGQARRYSADFSSFTPLTVPEPVDKFSSQSVDLAIELSNGETWAMNNHMTAALSNSFTTLRAFTHPAFALIESFSFNQTILDYSGLPLTTLSDMTPFHILAFNRTIKVIYKNNISTAFNFGDHFGSNSYCSAVYLQRQEISCFQDYINITYTYFEAITEVGLVQIKPLLSFKYNFSTLSYDLTLGSSYLILSLLTSGIASMMMANGVLLMQTQAGGLLLNYGLVTGIIPYFDSYISNFSVLQFIYQDGSYYILHPRGLVEVQIIPITAQFLYSNNVKTLPQKLYRLASGSVLGLLYVPFEAYIYKTMCSGQSYYYGSGTCIGYSCAVGGCSECKLTANTCGVCSAGFVRSEDLTCSNETEPANSTNSTASSTTNATTANTTYNNSTIKYFFYVLFPIFLDFPWLQDFFFCFVNTSKTVIAVPSMRRLTPLFYYFGNFDDLFLYKFHDRLYGPMMNGLFEEIDAIEAQKGTIISYTTCLYWLGIRKELFQAEMSAQSDYLAYAYSTPELRDLGSEGLLANCANFFLVGFPLTILGFLLLRVCFRLLFRFPVSRLLRKFDLWGYFLIIIFDGNVQQFAFYLAAEWRSAFAFSFGKGCLKAGVFIFGFILVLASVGGFLVSFSTYKRLNRHLTDNNYNNLKGNAYLLLQCGFRNFLLGILHSILRPLPYTVMLSTLIAIELLFFVVFVASIALKAYRTMHIIWLYIMLTLIRILLISTLFFDYSHAGDNLIESIQCTIIVIMMITYCVGTLIAVLTTIFQFGRSIINIFKSQPKQDLKDNDPYASINKAAELASNNLRANVIKNAIMANLKARRRIAPKTKTAPCDRRNIFILIDANSKVVRQHRINTIK